MAAATTLVPSRRWVFLAGISVLISIVSILAAPPAPARADQSGPRPFATEGDCTESLVQVPVGAAKAQALLPEGFVAQDTAGLARVTVFAEDCVMSVDGHAEFATTLSGTGVVLKSPAGSYGLTWNSDAGEYFGVYNRLGVGSLITESEYEATQIAPGTIHSEALIPGDFSLSFDSSDATSPNDLEDAITSVHWAFGRFGAVRGTYPHDLSSIGGGVGILEAASGSPLAQLIGTDPVQAPGLFFRFHFTGIVELVDPNATVDTYGWAVDGAPLGPNVSATSDGYRIQLSGEGAFSVGGVEASGGGSYRVFDPEGEEIASGEWDATHLVSYTDQGTFFPALEHFRKGVLEMRVHLRGIGAGRLALYCHADPGEIEGVIVRARGWQFDVIEKGSTTLTQD